MPMSQERIAELLAGCSLATVSGPDELLGRYIEQDSHRPGADHARITDYGVSVRALITALSSGSICVGEVAKDYELPEEAVAAALLYYARHKDLIDARIAVSEAFFEEDRGVGSAAGSRG